tara:strand:- start:302 stop:892 length:591 start_codon:yes stop_codon:yes gene_type:complete
MPYVYRHIRLDKNEPFYIGIGSDMTNKRANERARRSELWKKIVAKSDYEIEILFDDITYEEAKLKEIEFIKLYGRIDLGNGTLANLTNGGDGTINPSQETRDKISKVNKGRKNSEALMELLINRTGKKNPAFGITGVKCKNFKGYIQAFKDGVYLGKYEGIRHCAESLGVTATKVSAVLNGKRNHTGGYTFKRIMP